MGAALFQVVFGSSLLLTGLMRGVGSASLSSSLDGALWTPVRKLAPAGDGSLSLAVRPTQTMRYRIEAKGGASPALLVRVAPRVRLAQPTDPRVLSGSVRPRLTGASVAVERQSATGWTSVADAVVDQSGAFRAKLTVAPGTYRARVPPTNGFAQGLAPVLTVSG